MIINLVVSQYDANLVLEAVRVTGLVTVGMMFLGSMFPDFFARISVALAVALLLAIVVQLVHLFILGFYPEVVDWILVLIFCGYIGFDWGRANQIPRTLDNAVDSAAALYMDIINLFLHILRIMGRK
ncbi:Bax inhibitor-1 family protein [Gilvimarinus sp. F26214L]|uniref:Bax inhibitor-1 family protein n=1 Tax=Gilvimarinus sp. DZF01 TaxID=3461371 RepID=UPI0040465D79